MNEPSGQRRVANRRRRAGENRDAIVGAAAELFWREGYASTPLAAVAGRAGIPAGNMFYYFRTKAELAKAVADIFVEETEAMLRETEREETDPRRRLAVLVARLSRSLRSRVEWGCPIALGVRDFRREAPQAGARAAEAFSLLAGFIAHELGRTGQRPSLALGQARAALAEWQGGIMLAHAMQDASILAESFRRMERTLVG